MSYDQSYGSNRYNKEERGGWYCTNPKKHDENQQHHATDKPHVHRAERNEQEPMRQPDARQLRPKSMLNPSMNAPAPVVKKNNLVKAVTIILLWIIFVPIMLAILCVIFSYEDSNNQEEYYDEYYDEDISTSEQDSLFFDDDTSASTIIL